MFMLKYSVLVYVYTAGFEWRRPVVDMTLINTDLTLTCFPPTLGALVYTSILLA